MATANMKSRITGAYEKHNYKVVMYMIEHGMVRDYRQEVALAALLYPNDFKAAISYLWSSLHAMTKHLHPPIQQDLDPEQLVAITALEEEFHNIGRKPFVDKYYHEKCGYTYRSFGQLVDQAIGTQPRYK